jgi:hypothetical protein
MTPETGTLEVDHALAPVGEVTPAPPVDDDTGTGRRVDWVSVGRSTGRFVLAILGALALFGVFMWAKGVNPFGAYQKMFSSTFTSWKDWGEIPSWRPSSSPRWPCASRPAPGSSTSAAKAS